MTFNLSLLAAHISLLCSTQATTSFTFLPSALHVLAHLVLQGLSHMPGKKFPAENHIPSISGRFKFFTWMNTRRIKQALGSSMRDPGPNELRAQSEEWHLTYGLTGKLV
ncbi:uncharacterized protein LY89DRAFT_303001 [Mollisia scopiformis]|uniref:Secreted protein n=1 Tax=Mollisia scopiformis TaxID=149040 RepID=A0A194XR64_MOLSC|nr:uncharacterized protein LY89DRAFT_303001 [Mollisia scopiformis]KUJ22544.1 hypothetical protein LY89DRAFT_303001 [Mollisia scopiformis]